MDNFDILDKGMKNRFWVNMSIPYKSTVCQDLIISSTGREIANMLRAEEEAGGQPRRREEEGCVTLMDKTTGMAERTREVKCD